MSADRPVQFGILGVGRIAVKAYVPAINDAPNAELAAAASRDITRAESVNPKRAYGSYEALLDDPEVEAVYIATHNGLHLPLALAAFERGKHVLCEKPLANDAPQCAEMIEAAAKADRLLVEAFMYRYHPSIKEAKRLIDDGAIGELRTVEGAFSYHMESTTDVRLNPKWGGGGLLDIGTYCVNACRLFFDEVPRAVTAMGDFHPEYKVDMALHGLLDFGSGRYGVISSGFDAGFRNRILACGTGGTIELPKGVGINNVPVKLILKTKEETREIEYEPFAMYQAMVEDFANAVRGSKCMIDSKEGLRNAVVMDALLESAKQGGNRVGVSGVE
ncbi:MAG: Gfo/Idh/MocA family oxidoreductase [Phycisphaerales bacterium]|nr:Gfo/Idh/MocA family oxidoreductase [Phycisphaerales bacterium]